MRHLSSGLIWLNMFFLLSIMLMPFTTAYQSEYAMLAVPWVAYSVNIIATGLLQAHLQANLRNSAHGVVALHEHDHPDLDPLRPLLTPPVFGSSIALVLFIHPRVLRMVPMVIFPLTGIYFRRRHRQLEQTYAQRWGTKLPVAQH